MKDPGFFFDPLFLKWQGGFHEVSGYGISLFVFGNDNWLSPLRAPYGGFIFRDGFREDKFRLFLDLMDQKAEEKGISSIEIQLAPGFYFNGNFPAICTILEEAGFLSLFTDLNFHLKTDRSFRQYLHPSERWKLKKSELMGFHFQPVRNPDLRLVHSFILASRQRKGYQLSMTADDLKSAFTCFPDIYRVWEVRSAQGLLAALAVSVQVSDETEYLFYTADDPVFRSVSPVVMLHAGIVDAISSEGKRILDLGTASLRGEINKGVADFKGFLGGISSAKIRYRKSRDLVL